MRSLFSKICEDVRSPAVCLGLWRYTLTRTTGEHQEFVSCFQDQRGMQVSSQPKPVLKLTANHRAQLKTSADFQECLIYLLE
jgi:hypothetical protein